VTEGGGWAKDAVGRDEAKSGGELRKMNGSGRGRKLQPETGASKQMRCWQQSCGKELECQHGQTGIWLPNL